MNTEIIKAMNRKNEKHPVRDWWNKNGYKVMRVVLFPVWGCEWASEKIKDKMDAQVVWSDERANEILSYYVPRKCEWDEENQELYFFDNGYGWQMCSAKKYLKFKDRRFWNKMHGVLLSLQASRILIISSALFTLTNISAGPPILNVV